MRNKNLTILIATLLVGGCSSETDTSGARAVSPEGDVTELSGADKSIAELAVETLAEHLNIPIASIEVDTVRAVDWPNSAVGCPEPDRAYLDVITPGHKVTLRVDGVLHFVHEAKGRAMVCESKKSVSPVTPQFDLVWGQQAVDARADLAARLGLQPSQVRVVGAKSWTWRDTAMGCPQPGVEIEPGTVAGYKIELRAGSRNYTYHTDLERLIPCPPISED